jgi:hypothetical protein
MVGWSGWQHAAGFVDGDVAFRCRIAGRAVWVGVPWDSVDFRLELWRKLDCLSDVAGDGAAFATDLAGDCHHGNTRTEPAV